MSDSVYAVVAYIARYWFVGLMLIILWRAIVWLRKDADQLSRIHKKLPDAGYIGEWAVVATNVISMPPGTVLRAPRDGWIGSNRACDVRLRNAGVPAQAARFYLRSDGLHVLPERSESLLVDGEPVKREAVMRHGATLTVGGVTLQLRLFAGVLLEGETPLPPPRRQVHSEPESESPVPMPKQRKRTAASPPKRRPSPQAPAEAQEAADTVELPKPAFTIKKRTRGER